MSRRSVAAVRPGPSVAPPDGLPLGPLAAPGRRPQSALPPRRQYRAESPADHGGQFGGGKEMDVQPGLGPAAVADREAAVAMLLPALVRVLDVRASRVDPEAEQAAGPDPGGRGGQVLVRLGPGAVLEDLDADDQVITGHPRQCGQVAGDQPAGPVRPPGP